MERNTSYHLNFWYGDGDVGLRWLRLHYFYVDFFGFYD